MCNLYITWGLCGPTMCDVDSKKQQSYFTFSLVLVPQETRKVGGGWKTFKKIFLL
jgi:hypothetical protein